MRILRPSKPSKPLSQKDFSKKLAEGIRHTSSNPQEGLEDFTFGESPKPKGKKKTKKKGKKTSSRARRSAKTVFVKGKDLISTIATLVEELQNPPETVVDPLKTEVPAVVEDLTLFMGWQFRVGYPYGPSYGIVVTATKGSGDETEEFEISQDDPNGDHIRTLNQYDDLTIAAAVSLHRKKISDLKENA